MKWYIYMFYYILMVYFLQNTQNRHPTACPGRMSSRVTWWRHQMETFSVLLALCTGNSPVTVNSPHKGQWRRALMFSLICTWINDWVNKGEAGDLRCHRPHYDVTVMLNTEICSTSVIPVIYAVFLFCHSIKMRLYCLLFLWCVQYINILNSVIKRISYTNTWKNHVSTSQLCVICVDYLEINAETTHAIYSNYFV